MFYKLRGHMADWNSNLTKGISSNSGLVQNPTDFKLVNTSAGSTSQVQGQNFNAEYVKKLVLQRNQEQQAAQLAGENKVASKLAPAKVAAIPGANPYGVARLPWVFSTFGNLTTNEKVSDKTKNSLIWYANPISVDWQISQRASEVKTKAGTVLHVWRDRARQTDYDDPKITLTFQSGNIMPSYSNGVNTAKVTGVPDQIVAPGLNNFYQFLELVDASKINKGQANLIHILYRSRIFPSMVLTGFFDPQTVIRFTDSADKPFQINSWSATFTVYNTIPALNKWSDLKKQFEAEFKANDPFNKIT